MINYNSVPVSTEECYDDETQSMRWEILINGWSAGNSASAASAIERGKWLVQDPGGRATLARLGFKKFMFCRTQEEVRQHREAQIAARRQELRQRSRR